MSRGGVNTFVLIMYFLNDKWEPCYITVNFFDIVDTSRSSMVLQVNNVLENMGLKFLFLHMSKMKGVIFHITSILTSLMFHGILGLLTLFVGSCWSHAMSKCC
jgi:hypothetical protein